MKIYFFLFLFLFIFQSCQTTNIKKEEQITCNFTSELRQNWENFIIETNIIINNENIKPNMLKIIKTKTSSLYSEHKDIYSDFPSDLSIKIEKLLKDINNKMQLATQFYEKKLQSIDIIPKKVIDTYILGTVDDGITKEFTEDDIKSKYGYPLTEYTITSQFGFREDPFDKSETKFHHGVDFSAPIGTPVKAANYGKVIFADENGGYGLVVIILHSNSIMSLYAHLDEISVSEGDYVRKNTTIGTVGESGRATGPHLHFEIRENDEAIDPIMFLESQYITSKKDFIKKKF